MRKNVYVHEGGSDPYKAADIDVIDQRNLSDEEYRTVTARTANIQSDFAIFFV